MDKKETSGLQSMDQIAHQRWLMDHGLINDLHRDNLYMYGAILHKWIQYLELDIDVENKLIKYRLFVTRKLFNQINKYQQLAKKTTLFGLWRFKRYINKYGNLNFETLIQRFVIDYAGPKWKIQANIFDITQYSEEELLSRQDSNKELDQSSHTQFKE